MHKNIIKTRSVVLLAIIVGILNVLFLKNFNLALSLVLIEIIILVYLFLKNDIANYIGCYLIFLSLSFEFNFVLGEESLNFFGFKSFKIFGMNLGIIFLLPIIFRLFLKGLKIGTLKRLHPQLFRLIQIFIIFCISGILMGLFNLATNDNNILNLNGVFSLFVGKTYQSGVFPLLIIGSFIYLYLFEQTKIVRLNAYIYAILIGVSSALITSFLTGNTGFYGGLITLLSPLVSNLIPFLLLILLFDNRIKYSPLIIILYAFALFLLLTFNSSGKLFIFIITIPILVIFNFYKQKKYGITFVIVGVIIFTSIPILTYAISIKDNLLFSIKLNQTLSLLNIFNENWFSNLPPSPQFRVAEFINICHEYFEKPWQIFFGKGYLGSIKDHQNIFDSSTTGSFSENQWRNGSFYAMHMSINTLFLAHGIVGLVAIFYIIKLTFKRLISSPLGVIGAVWFIIYYGYSITLSSVGLICLLISLFETERNHSQN